MCTEHYSKLRHDVRMVIADPYRGCSQQAVHIIQRCGAIFYTSLPCRDSAVRKRVISK